MSLAVEYTLRRETAPDGTETVTETVRVTYSQDWKAYNAAKTGEKDRFAALLADLCGGNPQPEQAMGRPRLPLRDMVFASVYKVYCGFSSRRFACDLRDAHAGGLISKAPHFNSVSNHLSDPDLTGILKELVAVSSLPLRAVETDFAVDSSGFTTGTYARWFDHKHGGQRQERDWFKAHLICGVKTNIVAGVDISGRDVHDSYFFGPLVKTTAENFAVREVSADKAYLGRRNMELVEGLGATPFIPFKSNTVEPKGDSVWARMYHYFMFRREEFLSHYHKRSNAETAFSMIKRNFGASVKSKSEVGQVNEVLAKVLCHNVCVLVQAIHGLGIEPIF